MDVPPIRYVRTADGVNIAYNVVGNGPPVVWLMPNPHLSLTWEVPSLRDFVQRISKFVTLINIDSRGAGLSDRNVSSVDTATFITDLTAVLDDLHLTKAAFLSGGIAASIALTFAKASPERVSRMVLMEASLGNSGINQAIQALRSVDPRLVAEARAAYMVGFADSENAAAYATLQRETRSTASHDLFYRWLAEFELGDICPYVMAPALFIHASQDELFPKDTAQLMVAAMPSAMLRVFPGSSGFDLRRNGSVVDLIVEFLLEGSAATKQDATFTESLSASRTADPAVSLSKREKQVLRLVASGMTNGQIAERLNLSSSTVSHHMTSIFTKTGVDNRTEAAAFAVRHGID